jgi:hypothetical protein
MYHVCFIVISVLKGAVFPSIKKTENTIKLQVQTCCYESSKTA